MPLTQRHIAVTDARNGHRSDSIQSLRVRGPVRRPGRPASGGYRWFEGRRQESLHHASGATGRPSAGRPDARDNTQQGSHGGSRATAMCAFDQHMQHPRDAECPAVGPGNRLARIRQKTGVSARGVMRQFVPFPHGGGDRLYHQHQCTQKPHEGACMAGNGTVAIHDGETSRRRKRYTISVLPVPGLPRSCDDSETRPGHQVCRQMQTPAPLPCVMLALPEHGVIVHYNTA